MQDDRRLARISPPITSAPDAPHSRLRGQPEPGAPSRPRHHLVITGTGRAGTTLLVQYLTLLDFETGIPREKALRGKRGVGHAGFEHREFPQHGVPYVLKAPALAGRIGPALTSGEVTIDAAIVPVRDLYAAAESRRAVSRKAARPGEPDAPGAPGGIWRVERPEEQEAVLLNHFYRLVETLVRYDVPTWFLPFPEFARDHDVLWARLGPLLERFGVSRGESARTFAAVVRPDWIHDFAPPAASDAPADPDSAP